MTENYPVHAKDPLAEVAAKVLSYQGSPAMAPPILTPVSQMTRAFAAEVARLTSDREQARSIAVTLEQENARLTAELADLTERASRVSYSHQRFIEDSSDPGSEALGAQYVLINKLSALPGAAELPLNPAETALRVVLATLDETQDDASAQEIRGAIAAALPNDSIDNRRRIYIDGKGNAWLSVATDVDGTEYIAPIDSPHNGDQSTGTVRETTGSLREIGRTP